MTEDRTLDPYFKEVSAWEEDRLADTQRWVKILTVGALAGWLVALAAAIALGVLIPLKRVEPYLVRVDNTTGVVDVVPTVTPGASVSDAVTRYLLTHYVQVCERFDFPTAESDYEECAALHSPRMNQRWAARWTVSNPDSPLNRYRDGTTVRADVQSVTFFERSNGVKDLAQVRYLLLKRIAGSESDTVSHWVATLQYAYTEPSSEPRLRRWNPLGLRVVEFKPEPEVAPPTPTSVAQTSGKGTP